MTDLQSRCPACDWAIAYEPSAQGFTIVCPHCGISVQIPKYSKGRAGPTHAPPSHSSLAVKSVLPQGDEMRVAGNLRGTLPKIGATVALATSRGVQNVVVRDVTTMGGALEEAANSGAQVVSSPPSSQTTRCVLLLSGLSPDAVKLGDTVNFAGTSTAELQVGDDTIERTVAEAINCSDGDCARFSLSGISIEEVVRRVESALPTGWRVWKKQLLSGGKDKWVEGRGDSSLSALNSARNRLPEGVQAGDAQIESYAVSDELSVEAFSEQEARDKAEGTFHWRDIQAVEQKSRGKSGFLGFGRRPNTYAVRFPTQAHARIPYRERAEVKIVAIDSEKASTHECMGDDAGLMCKQPAVVMVHYFSDQMPERTFLCKRHASRSFTAVLRNPSIRVLHVLDLLTKDEGIESSNEEISARSFMKRKLDDWQHG